MRINYYGYYLTEIETGRRILYDIRPFLNSFCKDASADLKNSFTYTDEYVYLFRQVSDLYIFVVTRSKEIIKKVNRANLDIDDVRTLLAQEEHLGFASYVMMKEHHFAFGSTVLAPRFTVFADFVSDVLRSAGFGGYKLSVKPLLHQATKQEVLAMNFLGRTSLQIDRRSNLFKEVLNVFQVPSADADIIDSLEITFRPKTRDNIKPAIDKIVTAVPDDGLSKMVVKAKMEARGAFMDLYLAGIGQISDSVTTRDEAKLGRQIEAKMRENTTLHAKIQEFERDGKYEKANLDALSRYAFSASGAGSLVGV